MMNMTTSVNLAKGVIVLVFFGGVSLSRISTHPKNKRVVDTFFTVLLDRTTECMLIYPEGSPFEFFPALCDFFSKFFPFKFFDILQQTEVSKSPKGLPFLLFRHYETVSTFSFFVFFRKFFQKIFPNFLSPKGPPSSFLIFCSKLDFQKVERVPLLQF